MQLHPEPWETPGPHRVSVNSFGYGGSNAHIVLEDAPGYLSERGIEGIFRKANHNGHHTQLSDGEDSKNGHWQASNGTRNVQDVYRSRLFVVSGFDEGSCSAQIQNLHEYLSERSYVADDCFMDNLAFTLNERRSKFMWKGVVTGGSPSSVAEALSSRVKPRRAIKRPSIGFVFTGQGAQWCGMGKELWATYPVFRRSIERIDEYLGRIGAPFSVEGKDYIPDLPIANNIRGDPARSRQLPIEPSATQPADLLRITNRTGRSFSLVGNIPGFCYWSFKRRDCSGICGRSLVHGRCNVSSIPSRGHRW